MIKEKPKVFEIGETYLKFKFDFSEPNRLLVKNAYVEGVSKKSKEILKSQEIFKISIEYDEGSLKTRFAIWGTAATIYMGVANYGSFRAGIREIVQDVQNFSEFVSDRLSDDPEIGSNNIDRLERRTGFPGRINDVYNRIEYLERNLNNLTLNQVQAELNSLKQEIANLAYLMSGVERQQFINELPPNYSNNLPNPSDRRTNYLINRYGLKPDEDYEFIEG